MKKALRIGSFFLVLALCAAAMAGCSGRKQEQSAVKGTPQINFDENFYDFGTIAQGEKVSHTFKFRNIGSGQLVITDVTTSCGCTASKYSLEPVAPGAEGIVEVIFDSYGREGRQMKKISVWTNCGSDPVTLKILTNIEAK
ncbi:MAG: DUF1573 domain-containing protein [Salinivirgaceae bacterium]|nr:DUF1573 domain-containing protein [Salinivirgaceae bacterium]